MPKTNTDHNIKLQVDTKCPHCKFLYETFLVDEDSTDRDYHRGDVCDYSECDNSPGVPLGLHTMN